VGGAWGLALVRLRARDPAGGVASLDGGVSLRVGVTRRERGSRMNVGQETSANRHNCPDDSMLCAASLAVECGVQF